MLIGRLSKKSGFSRDTIRFYEKRGLIPAGVKENEYNNYKNYSDKTLEKLLAIKKLKGFGFTLNEISGFLELLDINSLSCENISQKMVEKIRTLDAKINELKEIKNLIVKTLNACPTPTPETETEHCPMVSVDT